MFLWEGGILENLRKGGGEGEFFFGGAIIDKVRKSFTVWVSCDKNSETIDQSGRLWALSVAPLQFQHCRRRPERPPKEKVCGEERRSSHKEEEKKNKNFLEAFLIVPSSIFLPSATCANFRSTPNSFHYFCPPPPVKFNDFPEIAAHLPKTITSVS